MTNARTAYDRARGDYARANEHEYFSENAHNAGLEGLWRIAYDQGVNDQWKHRPIGNRLVTALASHSTEPDFREAD